MVYQPKKTTTKKLLGLHDILTFGKYADYTIKEILDEEPSYITWCVDQEIFDITVEVDEMVYSLTADDWEDEGPDIGDSLSIY